MQVAPPKGVQRIDPLGNTTRYRYAGTRLKSISETDPRGKTTTYGYDAEGNLDEIVTHEGNRTTMSYDSSGRMTSLVDPRGNETGANPADFESTFTYDNADRLLTQTDPVGNQTSFTYDDAGNLKTRTDVAESYEHGPFGDGRGSASPGAPENPMRFTGEYLDGDTGLYYLRARQYDPGLGRFLSTDPLAPALTDPYVSAYVYANNRSTFSVDPSGLRGVPGLWEGGFFSVWRDGFQVTPLWVKIALGAGIVIPAGYLAGPALLSASVRAAAFARGPGSNLLAGLFGLFAGTTTKSTAEVFGSNGPTASGLGGCVGTALPAFFMGGGGGLVALACGAGVLFGLGVDRK